MLAIECSRVSVEFDGRLALENIDMALEERSFNVIFGPNGAGKTTLLRVLLGQLSVTGGSVKIFGENLNANSKLIGYVPQGVFAKRSFPISVIKTVMLGRLGRIGLFSRAKQHDLDICTRALSEVGLEGFDDKPLEDLSGGQRQRVFIARALAAEPKILLLDEATSGVDIGAKEGLYELLSRLKNALTVVFVTHDMAVMSRGVDQVICLNRTLISHGKPEEALSDEALKCMYGERLGFFAHCSGNHFHVHQHK